MADPTLRLTFSELRIRVADYLGLADFSGGDAALPSDAHDLALVGRLVNDGYRRFITAKENWNFLTIPLTLTFGTGTVSSDDSRYYLPEDFYGILTAPFTFDSDGPVTTIRQVSEGEIRALQAGQGDSTGDPVVFAVRPIATTAASTGQRWEAIFWPTPDGTEIITAAYKRFPQKLTNTGDVSVAGFQHDGTVEAAALAAAELKRGDSLGVHEKMYRDLLEQSKRIDAQAAPATLGDYGDKGEGAVGRRFTVATYNGVAL